jgi:hypothetical protein
MKKRRSFWYRNALAQARVTLQSLGRLIFDTLHYESLITLRTEEGTPDILLPQRQSDVLEHVHNAQAEVRLPK